MSRALANSIELYPESYRKNIIRENLDNLEKDKIEYRRKINSTKKKLSFLMKIEFVALYSITVFNLVFGSFTLGGIIKDVKPALISIESR